MATYTPTPWRIEPAEHGNSFIKSGNAVVCETYTYLGDEQFERNNAAFIVRAVNCHDELVSAIEATRALVSECAKHGFAGYAPLTELFTNNARLTSALRQARGETP